MDGMTRIIVLDRTDAYLCEVDPSQVMAIDYEDEVGGVHSLTVTTTQALEKTNRLLVRDGMGIWHEYVVLGIAATHGAGTEVVNEYYCVWSLQYDLSATFVNDQYGAGIVPGHASVPQTARHALEVALGGTTRWSIGTVTVLTMAAASFYRRSGWEGLKTVLDVWGGELQASITISGAGSSLTISRAVDLIEHIGATEATRRFDFGHDVTSIRRTVSDDVWPCRIVPLGKAVETEAGGYTRRPDISSVNSGVMWLQDDDVVPLTRVPDGQGGWEYPTVIVKNDTYELPSDLKAWAEGHISDFTRPKVTYEAELVQFVRAGLNPHGVALGDEVVVVDRTFGDNGLRINARVVKISGSMLDPSKTKLTIGNAMESIAGQLAELSSQLNQLEETVSGASDYQATAEYLSNLLDRINEEVNATGGYVYITKGQGQRTYDVAVSNPLVGSEASQVVEIKGGNIRIANSRTSSGDWDWKTVLQSGHILAELVTAVNIVAGYIGSADSGNYWNLDTGELRMAALDNLRLGATNLIRNGDFSNGVSYWTGNSTTRTVETDSTFGQCLKAVQGAAGSSSCRVFASNGASTYNFNHEAGKTYSVSFWAKADADNTIFCNVSASLSRSYVRGEAVTTSWQRYTGTLASTGTGALNFWLGAAGTLYLTNVMLVESDKPMLTWGPDPRDALVPVNALLTQTEIFNRLTNNGSIQGLYMSGNQLYINASYIASGYLSASLIQGGTLKLGGSNNGNGTLQVYNSSGTLISTIDNTGANLTGDITLETVYTTNRSLVSKNAETAYGTQQDAYNMEGRNSGYTNLTAFTIGRRNTSSDTYLGKLYLSPPQSTTNGYHAGIGSDNAIAISSYFGKTANPGYARLRLTEYFELYGYRSSSSYEQIKSDANRILLQTVGSDRYIQLQSSKEVRIGDQNYALVVSAGTTGITMKQKAYAQKGLEVTGSISSTTGISTASLTATGAITGGGTIKNDNVTLYNSTSTSTYSTITGSLRVSGNLTVSSTKNRAVDTEDYGKRLLYCDETPSPTFTDFGSGTIGDDGLCYVEIDDVFAETARADMAYRVFLQKCGQGDLWVDEKAPTHFVVRGTAGLPFDWQLKAHQKDYEHLRLEDSGIEEALVPEEDTDFEILYSDELSYINGIESLYEEDLNEAA